jgi:hypothetical protein
VSAAMPNNHSAMTLGIAALTPTYVGSRGHVCSGCM